MLQKLTCSLYVIGGYYWHPLCEVHMWDPVSNTWIQGKDMPDSERESYSVALLGPDIYMTGGYRTQTVDALDSVWIYNTDSDEWTEGCPMITARYYHCSVALRGCIYAIGGYTAGAPSQETEFYDPLKRDGFLWLIWYKVWEVQFICTQLLDWLPEGGVLRPFLGVEVTPLPFLGTKTYFG